MDISAREKHELEKQMSDSALLNDAVEGLEHFKNTHEIDAFVSQLNANLHKQIEKKKKHKKRRGLKEQPWIYLAITIILSLLIICFIVIKNHMDNEKTKIVTPPAREITISNLMFHNEVAVVYCSTQR